MPGERLQLLSAVNRKSEQQHPPYLQHALVQLHMIVASKCCLQPQISLTLLLLI